VKVNDDNDSTVAPDVTALFLDNENIVHNYDHHTNSSGDIITHLDRVNQNNSNIIKLPSIIIPLTPFLFDP